MRYTIILLFLPLFSSPILCDQEETTTTSQEEFKCSLPDVKSLDSNLDITRFRSDFSKVSEVKFPGVIGPLKERLICKIKCIDGNWVGPLCSITPNGRFQPILRECYFRQDYYPLLAITFRNSSINKDTHFPHGSVISARCRNFGLYKLKGENKLRCENGDWSPDFPECIPTNVITNFTGDAPPALQYSVITGSAVVDGLGQLIVYPDSVIHLECVLPKDQGSPHWTWQSTGSYSVSWASEEDDNESVFRVTLRDLQSRHADQFTCTSPSGHTHTVALYVVNVSCPPISVTSEYMMHVSQGNRLGETQHFSCAPGFHLEGQEMLVCMGHGEWSSKGPNCVETLCPPLESLAPQLTLVEFNTSYGGRAVFKCSWGYRLVGAPGMECQANGTWSGDMPYCSAIYCPDLLTPENGQLITVTSAAPAQHLVGALMTYSCNEGFQMSGEPSIVCTEYGIWSHPPPFCVLPKKIRIPDTIYLENTTLVHVDE